MSTLRELGSLPHAAACRLVEDPDEDVRAALGFAVSCPDLLTRLAADTNISGSLRCRSEL